jgi:uncharacterized protein (TIGR04222 family)
MAPSSELYGRLQAFSFDAIDAQFPFSRRLARDNGWSEAYSQRAIEEYRRFAYLAVMAGHPVTPSDQVDQVWHLHLTYSRSYWEVFCPQVLEKPLHHEPTRGGAAEQSKFGDWYAKTLASYETLFQEKPPSDLWPDPEVRFGQDLQFVRVNRHEHWILPRFGLKAWQGNKANLVAAIGVLLLLTGCNAIEGFPKPFSFTGKEFLLFYLIISGVSLVSAIAWQAWLLRKNYKLQSQENLDLYESACLVGETRLADTAIVSLIQKGYMKIEEPDPASKGKNRILQLKVIKDADEDCHPIESAMLAGIPGSQGLRQIHGVVEDLAIGMREQLQGQKLLMDAQQLRSVRLYPALLIATVLGFGGVRILIGLSRDRPVGYLVTLCSFLAIFGWFSIWQALEGRWRSPAGDRLLEKLRENNRSLYKGEIPSEELAYGFALFGSTVFVGDEFGDLRSVLTPVILPGMESMGDSGCGAYGGDFSGGDSGCGGGGCGGCGGCGG